MIFLPSFVPRQCFHATPWLQLCSAQGWGLLPAICYLPLGSEQQCLEQAHHPEAAGRQATLTDRKTALKGIFPENIWAAAEPERGIFIFHQLTQSGSSRKVILNKRSDLCTVMWRWRPTVASNKKPTSPCLCPFHLHPPKAQQWKRNSSEHISVSCILGNCS